MSRLSHKQALGTYLNVELKELEHNAMIAEADVAVLIPVCGAKHEVIDNNVVTYSSHVESNLQ
jgi:hypothetical protein